MRNRFSALLDRAEKSGLWRLLAAVLGDSLRSLRSNGDIRSDLNFLRPFSSIDIRSSEILIAKQIKDRGCPSALPGGDYGQRNQLSLCDN